MAVLTGPLLSIDARGKFGGSLIYSKQSGTNYVKAYAVPTNPQSTNQIYQRSFISWLTKSWSDFSQVRKDTWLELAEDLSLSSYHAFLSMNTKRWAAGQRPVAEPDIRSTIPDGDVTFSVIRDDRTRYLHTFIELGNEPYLVHYHYGLSSGFSPSKTNLIGFYAGWEANNEFWERDDVTWVADDDSSYYFKAVISTIYGELYDVFPATY